MKLLLLLLVPMFLRETAIAFDGGGHEKQKKSELSTYQSKAKTLSKYSEFHQSCMDNQMTIRGEVAELTEVPASTLLLRIQQA